MFDQGPKRGQSARSRPRPFALFSDDPLEWRSQRPTAKELLQHRFVKYARKTATLAELITRHHDWKTKRPPKSPKEGDSAGDVSANSSVVFGTVMSGWAFDSVREDADGDEGPDTIGAARGARLGSVSDKAGITRGGYAADSLWDVRSRGRRMTSWLRCQTRCRRRGRAVLGWASSRRSRRSSLRAQGRSRLTSTRPPAQQGQTRTGATPSGKGTTSTALSSARQTSAQGKSAACSWARARITKADGVFPAAGATRSAR